MKKLALLACVGLLPSVGFAQLTVSNTAPTPPTTATTVGTCHSIDNVNIQIGTGSCLRGAAASNQCYLPTGVALDPTTAGGCPTFAGSPPTANNEGFTIQFWYLAANPGSFAHTFGDASWVGAAGAFRCFQNGAAGGGNFLLRGPLTQLATAGAPLTANVGSWIHFAVVVNGSNNTIEWYVNGAPNNQGPANITGSGTNFTCMGYNGSSAAGSDGNYDDYRVYNWARTAGDIMQDYTDGLAGLGAFSQAPLGPGTCFTLPDAAYYEFDIAQNAHEATTARNSEPAYPWTRLFTDSDFLSWGVSSPSPGPFAGTALINVFFGAGAQPRVEGYADPGPVPGGPYLTSLGGTSYGGIELSHCLSSPGPGAQTLLFMWPDSIGLGALGVVPCGGTAVPGVYGYGTSLPTPTNPGFAVPPGLFNTGDRVDIQWLSPDSTFFQAGGLGTSNRTVLEYVAPIPGEHVHVEARGVSSLQVTGFWEVHNTGDTPIQQLCIDLSTAMPANQWNPGGALNSGGTLGALSTFRRNTDSICDLSLMPGPTLDGVAVNGSTLMGNVLCFDFACPPTPNGGFEGPTDHFIFDSDLSAAGPGNNLIGATVTITYCNGVVQTGTMVADPADPQAAVLDT